LGPGLVEHVTTGLGPGLVEHVTTGLGPGLAHCKWVLEVLSSRVNQSEFIAGRLPPCVMRLRMSIDLQNYPPYTVHFITYAVSSLPLPLLFGSLSLYLLQMCQFQRRPFPVTQISRNSIP
jgi:hypothetical protein